MGQCACGCSEFITQPNAYDVYVYMAGQYHRQRTELTNDEFVLYCRECGTEQLNCEDKLAE